MERAYNDAADGNTVDGNAGIGIIEANLPDFDRSNSVHPYDYAYSSPARTELNGHLVLAFNSVHTPLAIINAAIQAFKDDTSDEISVVSLPRGGISYICKTSEAMDLGQCPDQILQLSGKDLAKNDNCIVPRPRNCFILYRQWVGAKILAENPGLPASTISQVVSVLWRKESALIRQHFHGLAMQEEQIHRLSYPTYHYTPCMREKPRCVYTAGTDDGQPFNHVAGLTSFATYKSN
ncbi:hypothetical protein B0T26DRAFT_876258 [Lasiosphaeria miniovina]|uniref:HMG box domain-containing protein n=1 Tax=Lasiosphaeria miniovina TaxID=1954250 RepID=A0AA40DJL5_9PEZI|nr:uncharacterized protein B0T26DRAFT_876258 [Lasiosphaeria miniovina]KAK0703147.1 hypothetical protein B0T26DRAFT_876258 [Lasiosphaeria miniovina]